MNKLIDYCANSRWFVEIMFTAHAVWFLTLAVVKYQFGEYFTFTWIFGLILAVIFLIGFKWLEGFRDLVNERIDELVKNNHDTLGENV